MTRSRRDILGGMAAALAMPGAAMGRRLAPGDRVTLAVIGAGGMGAANAARLTGQNIAAVADPDWDHVARSVASPERAALRTAYDRAERFTDYRRLFDRRRDLDAVLIAAPDHHHALAAELAMQRGLHVYVQKPLTHNVAEGRRLMALARSRPRLVTQMGNQGHSGDDGRRAVEIVRSGAIGRVSRVLLWTNRPIWPQGIARPAPRPVPAGLDWDVWLGPAAEGWGYHPDYAHFNWRGWTPFGTGALGDMGAHLMDFPVWALSPGLPTRVEARHTAWPGGDDAAARGAWPLATVTDFRFDRAEGRPVSMTWYDGGLMPPTPADLPAGTRMDPGGGVLYLGDRGTLMHDTYGENPVAWGSGAAERAAAAPRTLPRVAGGRDGHEMNWINAIRGTDTASSPFATAVPLNETMLLGMAALGAEGPLDYDAAAARFVGRPEADALLSRRYRAGWTA